MKSVLSYYSFAISLKKSLENISPYFSKNPTINFSDKIVVASKIVTYNLFYAKINGKDR